MGRTKKPRVRSRLLRKTQGNNRSTRSTNRTVRFFLGSAFFLFLGFEIGTISKLPHFNVLQENHARKLGFIESAPQARAAGRPEHQHPREVESESWIANIASFFSPSYLPSQPLRQTATTSSNNEWTAENEETVRAAIQQHRDFLAHPQTSEADDAPVAIFFNVFIPNNEKRGMYNDANGSISILEEQLTQIVQAYQNATTSTGRPSVPPTVYVTTVQNASLTTSRLQSICAQAGWMGETAPRVKLNCVHMEHVTVPFGGEINTLSHLYNYCQHAPDQAKAIYLHNKGSLSPSPENELWRRALTDAVVRPEQCLRHLWSKDDIDGNMCDVCGLQFVTPPNMFAMLFPGNFFAASCHYVKQLLPPMVFKNRTEYVATEALKWRYRNKLYFKDEHRDTKPWVLGTNRYAAEHWIVSNYFSVKPCDLSVSDDYSFWRRHSHNPDKDFRWSMYPRKETAKATLEGLPEDLQNPKNRLRYYRLLPGLLFRFISIYKTTPPETSWLYNFLPDGDFWRAQVKKHGIRVLDLLIGFHSAGFQLDAMLARHNAQKMRHTLAGQEAAKAVLASMPKESKSPYAYMFLIGGIHEDRPTYKGFIYDVLVATKLLQESGSTADVVLFLGFAHDAKTDVLPVNELLFLKHMGIIVHTLPKKEQDTFLSLVFEKFRALQLTQYRRVIFLDADAFPLSNMDYIFHLSDPQHTSTPTILQPNMILASKGEPCNAGMFMLAPQKGDWEQLQGIIQRQHEEGAKLPHPHFSWDRGWGYDFKAEHDLWQANVKYGLKWRFHAAHSDQGLLYFWTKFHKRRVSIVIQDYIENWIDKPEVANQTLDGNPKPVLNNTLINEPLLQYSPPQGPFVYQFSCDTPDVKSKPKANQPHQCLVPYRDFAHIMGTEKPWMAYSPINRIRRGENSSDFYNGAVALWFRTLMRLNEELGMGLDFMSWYEKHHVRGSPLGHMAMLGDLKDVQANSNRD